MDCSKVLEYWREVGYDPNTGVNPPFNMPVPLPPHQHENGFDARCDLCTYLREISQQHEL